MMYNLVSAAIIFFCFTQVLAAQNHFHNQLLGKCPEAELSFTTADNLRVNEGSGVLNLGITLSKNACRDVQVEYGYYSPSGIIGTHFSSTVSGSVTIPKGQKTASISFSILQNAVSETEKSVFVSLRGGKNTKQKIKLSANATKGILITDDESSYASISQLATAGDTTCMIIAGVLKCWGENGVGSLGNGNTTDAVLPYTVNPGTSYTAVSMGSGGAVCGITGSGVLRCWGSNFGNVLGDGTGSAYRTSPATIDSGTSYKDISVGHVHSCGITTAHVLKCWGATSNNVGQLGDGSTTSGTNLPKVINAGTSYAQVSVYGYNNGTPHHSCAITMSGELQCWGRNNQGQVGNNSIINQLSPVTIDAGVSYTLVRSGGDHTCGITTAGVLKCWGDNAKYQLGDGTAIDKLVPVEIDAGQTYSDVSLGDSYTCGVTTANKLKCWGDNTYYNLGNWTNISASSPIAIDSSENYSSVYVAGGSNTNSKRASTCALTTAGQLKCWGSNNGHWVLDATTSFNETRQINHGLTFAAVSVGGHSACGLSPSQDVYCWGANASGQLGERTTLARDYAVLVDPGVKYSLIDVGGGTSQVSPWFPHVCGITITGILKCWGANAESQLGDGTTVQINKPKVIDGGTTYSYVSSGYANTCAITTAGVLKCWGDNSRGQLGIGSTVDQTTPTVVASGTTFSFVDVSEKYNSTQFHTCAITTGGELRCWGSNNQGQLGNGTSSTTTVNSPVVIDAGESYSMVKVGAGHTQGFSCGLTTANKIKCWGNNIYGVLGVGDTNQRVTPTEVDAATDYATISVKGEVVCAITTAGQMRCWGSNFYGMVGDGTTTHRNAPVNVDAGTIYQSVDVGHEAGSRSAICGIETTTNKLKCRGFNLYGALMASPTVIGAPMFIPQVQVP